MAMDMDGWQDFLHFEFYGEHVLFPTLRLNSGFDFIIASLLTIFLCTLEKVLTHALSVKWNPLASRDSRVGNAAFRAAMYWIVTLIRLLYMLLAMTFHVGLIVVAVTTLSAGQFVIEYLETPHPNLRSRFADGDPLLVDERRAFAGSSEYLDLPSTTTTAGMTAGYPPKRRPGASPAIEGDTNGTNIFTIEDEDAK